MPERTSKDSWQALSPEDLATATRLARLRGAGRYTVKEIHGDHWEGMRRPRRYGVLFKRAVLAGELSGIRWVGRKSNKSQLYEILSSGPKR